MYSLGPSKTILEPRIQLVGFPTDHISSGCPCKFNSLASYTHNHIVWLSVALCSTHLNALRIFCVLPYSACPENSIETACSLTTSHSATNPVRRWFGRVISRSPLQQLSSYNFLGPAILFNAKLILVAMKLLDYFYRQLKWVPPPLQPLPLTISPVRSRSPVRMWLVAFDFWGTVRGTGGVPPTV